jgi:hypothetical protein
VAPGLLPCRSMARPRRLALEAHRHLIASLIASGLPYARVAVILGVSRWTLYRALKADRERLGPLIAVTRLAWSRDRALMLGIPWPDAPMTEVERAALAREMAVIAKLEIDDPWPGDRLAD